MWLARLATDDGALEWAATVVSAGEQERFGRMRVITDRRYALVRRAILRALLSRYVGGHAEAVALVSRPNERPSVAGADDLGFSMSSSGPVAAFVFSAHHCVGVDIERRDDRGLPLSRYLSARERRSLQAMAPAERTRRAWRVWVAKEAVAKAVGVGFRADPREIEVAPNGDLTLGGPWAPYASPDWTVRTILDEEAHVAAVAVKGVWARTVTRFCTAGPTGFVETCSWNSPPGLR